MNIYAEKTGDIRRFSLFIQKKQNCTIEYSAKGYRFVQNKPLRFATKSCMITGKVEVLGAF